MAWFAFDVDAYDADTMHLSAAEDGVYSRLLRFYYKTRLPLPDNDAALAAIGRVPMGEWEGMKTTVRAFFKLRRGKLHHKRCDRELDKEDSFARKRSEHAQKASHSRASVINKLRSARSTGDTPEINVVDLQRSTRPDQTIQKRRTPKPPEGAFAVEFDKWWAEYPHKVGRPVALNSFVKARSSGVLLETLIAGLAGYKAAKPPDRPWCNPSTWLNQQRWNDQPAPSTVEMLNGRRHPLSPSRTWDPAYIGEGWIKPRGPSGPAPEVVPYDERN